MIKVERRGGARHKPKKSHPWKKGPHVHCFKKGARSAEDKIMAGYVSERKEAVLSWQKF